MSQNVKTYYVPTRHAERVALNKKLREEQKPSVKNTIIKVGRGAAKILGAADKVVTKKLQNFLKDEESTNRRMARTLSSIDSEFKSMGPSLKGSWIEPKATVSEEPPKKKKKKSKKVK